MPMFIKQVRVKATIVEGDTSSSKKSKGDSDNTENIIAECVDRVMQILKEEKER